VSLCCRTLWSQLGGLSIRVRSSMYGLAIWTWSLVYSEGEFGESVTVAPCVVKFCMSTVSMVSVSRQCLVKMNNVGGWYLLFSVPCSIVRVFITHGMRSPSPARLTNDNASKSKPYRHARLFGNSQARRWDICDIVRCVRREMRMRCSNTGDAVGLFGVGAKCHASGYLAFGSHARGVWSQMPMRSCHL
jgi:hypothetical protein